MTITTVTGVPACDLSGDSARAVVGAVSRFLEDLHALGTAACPVDHRLSAVGPPASCDDEVVAGRPDPNLRPTGSA